MAENDPSGHPPTLRDARTLLAISRAQELAATARATELQRTVDELTRELELRSSQLLELIPLILPRADAAEHRVHRSVSAEAAAIGELFASIRKNRRTAESLVTVVIPVYAKVDVTLRCLRSIALSWSYSLNPTIVVVDDASPDESVRELMSIPGLELIRNGTNLGYLRSTNRGADLVRTRYICLLNNDTEVQDGWLDTLVTTAEADRNIGAVGSKLIYPDGTLQEAGGIIWSDATGWNYGRGDDPAKSEYNVMREVDYCSAASLLVRTDLLRSIGGFDERYAPAYYEDADLCFEIAFRGYRVVYQPLSVVVHFEGVSSGTELSSGVKRYQEINRPKFAEKWKDVLSGHFAPDAANVPAAVKARASKTILIIDSYVPLHDREAGSNRLYKIVQIVRSLGYYVLFFPANGAPIEPYSSDLARLGVEIAYLRPEFEDQEALLASIARRADIAWICRPELCERFLPIMREGSSAPIIYDTIDLHFARERRRAEVEQHGDEVWQRLQKVELAMARASDLIVTVTESERRDLAEFDITNVAVIPTIHDVEPHEHFGHAVRRGIVFIGGYGHAPNVDAALWLCRDIMPIVWRTNPDVHVTLLGNQPPESLNALRSDRVAVTGFVADVGPYFEEARLFVAPLRYGAGMKGKVGHALSYGLPVVTTSIGAEGYDLVDGLNCRIADTTLEFARAIVALYEDVNAWERFSSAGSDVIAALGLEAVSDRLVALFEQLGVHP